ncbi:MAG: lysylphosphatidylglycerol synthase transmembrane domain-containing protein [Bacteroidota bacterium]
MSDRLKTTLTLTASFALGGGLLWLALRGIDLAVVGDALANARWIWALPLLVVVIASHALRAWRWQLLLGAMPGEQRPVGFGDAFASLLVGYLVNQALPRLGEIARAGNLASRTDHTFAGVFGTVVVERVLDVLTLLLALGSVVLLFGDRLGEITGSFLRNAEAGLAALPVSAPVLVLLLVAVGLGTLALGWLALTRGGDRVRGLVAGFRDGLVSLLRVRQRTGLVVSTLGIWVLYALGSYIPLRMLGFAETYSLGLVDAWALMNLGAIGMSLPSPGGTGSYHYVVVQTLVLLFAMSATAAASYAILTHAAQVLLLCLLGAAALLWQGTSLRSVTRSARESSAG